MKFLLITFYTYFASLHFSLAAMETLIGVLILGCLLLCIQKRTFISPSPWTYISHLGLLFSATVSFTLNIGQWSLFIDYIDDFRWIINYLMWLQFFHLFLDKINFSRLISIAQTVLVIAGLYSIYQFFYAHDPFRPNAVFHLIFQGSKLYRPNSFFGLPTTYAYASAMFLCVSLSFLFYQPLFKEKWQAWVRGIYLVLSPMNIFLAFTRAAWIASLTSTFVILRNYNHRIFYKSLVLLSILFITLYLAFPPFQKRIHSITDPNYIANVHRIHLWKANLLIFSENPFFGLGFEENNKQIDTYLNRMDKPGVLRSHPHSTYLNYLASLGLTGFVFLMIFFAKNLWNAYRGFKTTTDPLLRAIFLGSLGLQIVLLIGGLTECTFEDNELTHQYILFTALCEYLRLKNKTTPQMR